ncbi:MAG: DUF3179 domain-containing (seleno)protein [Gemmatimonadales bacterium]
MPIVVAPGSCWSPPRAGPPRTALIASALGMSREHLSCQFAAYAFGRGTSRKKLTGTDTLSWRDTSLVVGLTVNGRSKAYDWNRFRRERLINDEVGGVSVVLVLADDTASFFAFVRPDALTRFSLRRDSLIGGGRAYALSGRGQSGALTPLNASQEFWHSWRTFQPRTERY